MKKALLIVVFLKSLVIFSQVEKTIELKSLKAMTRLTEAQLAKEESVANYEIDNAQGNGKFEIIYNNTDPQSRNALKYLCLVDTHDDLPIKGKVDKDKIIFTLDEPLKNRPRALYQLAIVHGSNKTFCQYALRLKEKEDDGGHGSAAPLPKLPEFTLTPIQNPITPCDGCVSLGNKIVYDFKDNSTKNEKSPGNTCRHFESKYLNKRWTRLPRVGEELEFEIANINTLKYDITIKDEQINLHPSSTPFLVSAFTPTLPEASSLGEDGDTIKKPDSKKLYAMAVLKVLDDAVTSKIKEIQRQADCYDPCEEIQTTVDQICHYYETNSKFDSSKSSLESFLKKLIDEAYPSDDSDEKAAEEKKKLIEVVDNFVKFRGTASGKFGYRVPQIKNVDQYIFTLNITPKEGVAGGKRIVNSPIAVDILGGFRADVSSGLFVTYLKDDKFTMLADSTAIAGTNPVAYSRRKRIIREDTGKYDFGVSALFHFYTRLTTNVNFAGSLGAGVTLNDKPKVRYLAGGSLLLGKTNRLSITYGAAMGYVEELSDKYSPDATGNIYTSYNDASVVVKKSFKVKPFLSLTYSIPIFEKKEEVKSDEKEDDKKEDDKDKEKNDDDKAKKK